MYKSPIVEEVLYPALEDFQLDIMIGEGPAARSIKLDLEPFTLVGATTRAGSLTSPLRDRFGIVQRLEFYKPQDLSTIVQRSARILAVNLDESGASDKIIPLKEQLKKDPYVQLAVSLMDKLALSPQRITTSQ